MQNCRLTGDNASGLEHDEVRQFLLDVAKFKAGGEGVPPPFAHNQAGVENNKGTTTTMMTATLNFMTMVTVIAVIVCAFVGPGSEIGSRRLFVINVINRMSCEGGDTTIKYRQQELNAPEDGRCSHRRTGGGHLSRRETVPQHEAWEEG